MISNIIITYLDRLFRMEILTDTIVPEERIKEIFKHVNNIGLLYALMIRKN